AYPGRAASPMPAVVVLQEAWGVDLHIEDVTRRFALAGYAALAPDLYAEGGVRPGPLARERLAELLAFVNAAGPAVFRDEAARAAAFAKLPAPEAARVQESMGTMSGKLGDLGAFVPALLAATKYLREERAETRGQKIGSVGYCLGGGLSALLACHDPQLAAACIYYGSAPPADLVPRIACPVFGFYGGEDARVNAGIPAFTEAMAAAGKRYESHVYPGAQHAFFNDDRPSYHAGASRDAFARTLEVWRTHLV
ncbi:MAG: dienelactone hydrolase family protein, partial [Polyangiaceae bacterium]